MPHPVAVASDVFSKGKEAFSNLWQVVWPLDEPAFYNSVLALKKSMMSVEKVNINLETISLTNLRSGGHVGKLWV